MPRVTKQSIRPNGLKETTEKPTKQKTAVTKEAKVVEPKAEKVKSTPKKIRGEFSVPVYSLVGKEISTLELPKEIFGVKVNKSLLSQAIRVYLNNQKAHWGNTKTRGEVQGSTRKIWKQKGTGRARHGSIMAPIFVGGGIALGPKSRKVNLDLPKQMKKSALISALSLKLLENKIHSVDNLEKASGKTKEMVNFIKTFGESKVLIVSDIKEDNVFRAVKNLQKVNVVSSDNVNVFDVIAHQSIVLTKEAVEKLQERLLKKKGDKEIKNG